MSTQLVILLLCYNTAAVQPFLAQLKERESISTLTHFNWNCTCCNNMMKLQKYKISTTCTRRRLLNWWQACCTNGELVCHIVSQFLSVSFCQSVFVSQCLTCDWQTKWVQNCPPQVSSRYHTNLQIKGDQTTWGFFFQSWQMKHTWSMTHTWNMTHMNTYDQWLCSFALLSPTPFWCFQTCVPPKRPCQGRKATVAFRLVGVSLSWAGGVGGGRNFVDLNLNLSR